MSCEAAHNVRSSAKLVHVFYVGDMCDAIMWKRRTCKVATLVMRNTLKIIDLGRVHSRADQHKIKRCLRVFRNARCPHCVCIVGTECSFLRPAFSVSMPIQQLRRLVGFEVVSVFGAKVQQHSFSVEEFTAISVSISLIQKPQSRFAVLLTSL